MILVDTSIWIDHFNKDGDDRLRIFLASESVMTHPFVVGEIAMGSLKDRSANLRLLCDLPSLASASEREVLTLVEALPLYSIGLTYIDAHLLAAARAARADQRVRLWSADKRLMNAAEEIGVAYAP